MSVKDPKFLAGIKLLERTGIQSFRIGHTDEDDGDPVIWHATATWGISPSTGRPMPRGGRIQHEAAGALHPLTAVMRLCELVVDGATCIHCLQHTIFDENPMDTPFDDLLNAIGCVYAWDPELKTFRRGCEGDT